MSDQKVENFSVWQQAIGERQATAERVRALVEEIGAEAIRLIKLTGHRTLGQTAFRIEGESRHDGGINDGIEESCPCDGCSATGKKAYCYRKGQRKGKGTWSHTNR